MATTTKGFPYPIGTQNNDVPVDMQALAEKIDSLPGIAPLTTAQRDALAGGDLWVGKMIWNSSTAKPQIWDGAVWSNVPLGVAVTMADAAPPAVADAGVVGASADAAREDHTHALHAQTARKDQANIFTNGQEIARAAAASFALWHRVTGEAWERWRVRTDGLTEWGPGGGAAPDTLLERKAANVLGLGAGDILRTDELQKLDGTPYATGGGKQVKSSGGSVYSVPASAGSFTVSTGANAWGAWTELTPGIAEDTYLVSIAMSTGNITVLIQLGVGASGAEVARYSEQVVSASNERNVRSQPVPFPIFVPANTRVAGRAWFTSVSSITMAVQFVSLSALEAMP